MQQFRPFCSKRCADVDLNRWLKGVYAVPVTETDDEDGDKAEDQPEPRSLLSLLPGRDARLLSFEHRRRQSADRPGGHDARPPALRRAFVRIRAGARPRPRAARAQAAYPARFVSLVVPFPPGGGTDAIARIVATKLSEIWGQQVVVENKRRRRRPTSAPTRSRNPIRTATRAAAARCRSAVNHFLFPSLTYDPVADLAPVSLICVQPNIMVVPNVVAGANR